MDGEPDLGMSHVGSSPWQQISKAVKTQIKVLKHFFWDFGNCIVSSVHAVRTGYHTCITLNVHVQRIEYVLTSNVLIQVVALTTACCVSLCRVIVAVLPFYWGSE